MGEVGDHVIMDVGKKKRDDQERKLFRTRYLVITT